MNILDIILENYDEIKQLIYNNSLSELHLLKIEKDKIVEDNNKKYFLQCMNAIFDSEDYITKDEDVRDSEDIRDSKEIRDSGDIRDSDEIRDSEDIRNSDELRELEDVLEFKKLMINIIKDNIFNEKLKSSTCNHLIDVNFTLVIGGNRFNGRYNGCIDDEGYQTISINGKNYKNFDRSFSDAILNAILSYGLSEKYLKKFIHLIVKYIEFSIVEHARNADFSNFLIRV